MSKLLKLQIFVVSLLLKLTWTVEDIFDWVMGKFVGSGTWMMLSQKFYPSAIFEDLLVIILVKMNRLMGNKVWREVARYAVSK